MGGSETSYSMAAGEGGSRPSGETATSVPALSFGEVQPNRFGDVHDASSQ